MSRKRSRRDRNADKPQDDKAKPRGASSDPTECGHPGHSKTRHSNGGYSRHCNHCDTTWWSSNG